MNITIPEFIAFIIICVSIFLLVMNDLRKEIHRIQQEIEEMESNTVDDPFIRVSWFLFGKEETHRIQQEIEAKENGIDKMFIIISRFFWDRKE